MFCRTRWLTNPFAVDRRIISLFDVESHVFVPITTRGQSRANFTDTVKLPAFKNQLFDATFRAIGRLKIEGTRDY